MSDYAIFFDYDNKTYRLPVNPEQIEVTTTQAIEKYEVLKLGQIAVPTHMELSEYSFECEFPHEALSYVETSGSFKDADYYLNLFKKWRDKLVPIRFIASNGIGNDINALVLIEELNVTEKAGEEGDKYVSFDLLEYREFGKKSPVVAKDKTLVKAVKTSNTVKVNPKSKGTYVVKSGDCLWSIAKKYYGDGSKHAKIYNANKSIIKNPNLIYPGQRLVIPA
ncbi:MAG: LysM peptidoglycan-binding domain-containing protein [Ruminiclostridium sp.]